MTYALKMPGMKPYFRGLGDWMDKKIERQANFLPLIALELLFRLMNFFRCTLSQTCLTPQFPAPGRLHSFVSAHPILNNMSLSG